MYTFVDKISIQLGRVLIEHCEQYTVKKKENVISTGNRALY